MAKRKTVQNSGFQLNDEEKEIILKQRDLDSVPEGSASYKVFVYNDPVRQKIRKHQLSARKELLQMQENTNTIRRLETELNAGALKDDNEIAAAKLQIIEARWLRDTNKFQAMEELMKIRQHVGFHDIRRQPIMSEDSYDAFVNEIVDTIRKNGADPFDEIGLKD